MMRPVAWRRMETTALFLVLLLLSARLLISATYQHTLQSPKSPLLYHAGTLAFNYFDFGFVRRGLGGSIVHLIGGEMLGATAIFHMLSAAAVSAVACLFVTRLEPPRRRATFVVLLVAIVMRWAEDAGRTDLAVAALVGSAAMALRSGRPVVATSLVAVGLCIHETSFVYGIPLLAGLAFEHRLWRSLSRRAIVCAIAVPVAALGLYLLLDRLPHADAGTMVDTVRSRLPRTDEVDWAIYYAISGGRGVSTSLCQNARDPSYPMHVGGGLLVIALFVAVTGMRGPTLWRAILVSVPSFLFLSHVANDISRWSGLAAMNVWWFAACSGDERAGVNWRWRPVAAIAAILLIHPKVYPVEYAIYVPTPVLERLAQRLLGAPRTPSVSAALAICDPGWREYLERQRAAAR